MQIIIDGYNLIFALRQMREDESRFDPNLQREKLLELLLRYKRRNPVRIHVVFDGRRTDYRSIMTGNVGGILCSYTPPEVEADELMMELIQDSSAPKSLLIVTGDRKIRSLAHKRRCKTATSEQFALEVARTLSRVRKPEPRQKYTGLSKSETDYWMKVMGFDDDDPTGRSS
jgi:predicted RNA-binding protein with PIN domain